MFAPAYVGRIRIFFQTLFSSSIHKTLGKGARPSLSEKASFLSQPLHQRWTALGGVMSQGLLCHGKPVLGEPGFLRRLEKFPRSRERQTNFRSAPWTVGTIRKL
jgi:hypothetical protein